MPIICGPILISSVSLPVAVLASAMCSIFCLRGPVLWLVSSYVATLFLLRAPARTAATGPLAPLVGAVACAARSGAVLVGFVNGCVQVCEISGRASSSVQARARPSCAVAASHVVPCRSLPTFSVFACSHSNPNPNPNPVQSLWGNYLSSGKVPLGQKSAPHSVQSLWGNYLSSGKVPLGQKSAPPGSRDSSCALVALHKRFSCVSASV
jgi:hypothetical protein